MSLNINNVNDILSNSQSMIERLTVIKTQLSDNFNHIHNTPESSIKIQSDIRTMKNEQDKYNTLFEEEESIVQAMGGRTRMQTLQEFVLTFFYIGFVLFAISISLYYYVTTGAIKEMFKAIGVMTFIALLVTGFLIRYS